MTVKVRVRVEGLNEIYAKLSTSNPIYAAPVRKVFADVTADVESKARKRAPKATGRLAGSIKSRLDARPMPLWARITVDGSGANNFRYPWALEAGHRRAAGQGYAKLGRKAKALSRAEIIFRYRGTRKSTKKWFRGASRGIRKTLQTLLSQAVKEVESRWAR